MGAGGAGGGQAAITRPGVQGIGPGAGFPHTAQAVEAGAAGDMEQHRFRLVVGGMADGYGVCPNLPRRACQELVAQIPRRLFKGADAVRLLVGWHTGFLDDAGQSDLPGQCAYECGVIVRFLAPEIVDEVGDIDAEAELPGRFGQAEQQGGGIGAAGYAGQYPVGRRQSQVPRRCCQCGIYAPLLPTPGGRWILLGHSGILKACLKAGFRAKRRNIGLLIAICSHAALLAGSAS